MLNCQNQTSFCQCQATKNEVLVSLAKCPRFFLREHFSFLMCCFLHCFAKCSTLFGQRPLFLVCLFHDCLIFAVVPMFPVLFLWLFAVLFLCFECLDLKRCFQFVFALCKRRNYRHTLSLRVYLIRKLCPTSLVIFCRGLQQSMCFLWT